MYFLVLFSYLFLCVASIYVVGVRVSICFISLRSWIDAWILAHGNLSQT